MTHLVVNMRYLLLIQRGLASVIVSFFSTQASVILMEQLEGYRSLLIDEGLR